MMGPAGTTEQRRLFLRLCMLLRSIKKFTVIMIKQPSNATNMAERTMQMKCLSETNKHEEHDNFNCGVNERSCAQHGLRQQLATLGEDEFGVVSLERVLALAH